MYLNCVMPKVDGLGVLIIVEEDCPPDGVELDLVDVDGGEHVPEHGLHQLDALVRPSEAVHDEEWVVLVLLLVGHLSLQGRPHISEIIQ